MRALLLTLLLLNLAFFAYTRLVGGAQEAPAATEDATAVPRLALVGETHTSGTRCASLGPFVEQAVAQRAAAWLLSGRHSARMRSAEVPGTSGYLVAITTKTLQDATVLARRLRAIGASDVEVVPPGPGSVQAAVSLGVYDDREHAQRRVADLKGLAAKPVIVEQKRTITNWWLDVDLRAREPAPDPAAAAKAAGGPAGLSIGACAESPPAQGPAAPAAPEPVPEDKHGGAPAAAANAPSTAAEAAKLSGAPA